MGAPRPADPALCLRWWLPCLAVPSGPCPSCWAPGCLADACPVPVVLGKLLTFLHCGLHDIGTSLGTENPWHVAQPSLCTDSALLPFGTVHPLPASGDVCVLGPPEEPSRERCGGVSLIRTFLTPRSPAVGPGAAPRGEAERSQLPGPWREEDGAVRP